MFSPIQRVHNFFLIIIFYRVYNVLKRNSNHRDRKKIVINPLRYLQATMAGWLGQVSLDLKIIYFRLKRVYLKKFFQIGHFFAVICIVILLHLTGRNEKGCQWDSESEKAFVKTKEYNI